MEHCVSLEFLYFLYLLFHLGYGHEFRNQVGTQRMGEDKQLNEECAGLDQQMFSFGDHDLGFSTVETMAS